MADREMFLNENQTGISMSCVANIEDKLAAIKNELITRERPHKPYLNEKLDSIYWDLKVMMNVAKINDDDNEDK